MTKAFTVASWNVEHFKNNPDRIIRVLQFLKEQNPDVFGLYEVESADVYAALVAQMPNYQFHITEGPQTQEILVGVKKTITAFFTQKVAFKSGNTYLRPGALLTVNVDGADYPILFLHTKSSTKPIGLGLRDDMFERAFAFRETLDKASAAAGEGPANYIFLGDLNTMGMSYPFQREIMVDFELRKLDDSAKKAKMIRLDKSQPVTWWNGTRRLDPSNLDHVIAASHLRFKNFGGAPVDVRGWPQLETESEQVKWIDTYSDHALLFFQVEKMGE
ncbi:endonuclease/exonuclease/phosphatase family protein [Flavisolibacter sp. BT320]|nr:endonuclease/exonuclease/phosphatase family protein [Flavisolibacter longurius]